MEVAGFLQKLPGEGSVATPHVGLKLTVGLHQSDPGSRNITGNHTGSWSTALPSAVTSSLRLKYSYCWVGLGVFLQLVCNSPSKRLF